MQRNRGKFNGVVSFRYYGEVLDPELTNLRILTLGIGLPQVPQFVQFFPTQLAVIMKSGIVPAGIFALVMDRILPRGAAE